MAYIWAVQCLMFAWLPHMSLVSCLLVGRHCSLWGWMAYIWLRCCLRFCSVALHLAGAIFNFGWGIAYFWVGWSTVWEGVLYFWCGCRTCTLGLFLILVKILFTFSSVAVHLALFLVIVGQGLVYVWLGWPTFGQCNV